MTDQELMEMAITLARNCQPADPARIPKVGAVIAVDGEVIAVGHRGDDDHAEKIALKSVKDRTKLPLATVYTTLEPCTAEVRRKPLESCTDLLIQAQVKKVVIGILDPNQGVCGKGVIALQHHRIEVRLFPHELAQSIRLENEDFIRGQQTLGIRIIEPLNDAEIGPFEESERQPIKCECINAPDGSVYLLVGRDGQWWPQFSRLSQVAGSSVWEASVSLGHHGPTEIHVVKANALGEALIKYYEKVARVIAGHKDKLRGKLAVQGKEAEGAFLKTLRPNHPGIAISHLPRGLDSQAFVSVKVLKKVD